MEPNQVNPSPENSEIPANVPAWVFVPNNQTPVQDVVSPTVVSPVSPQVVAEQTPVVPAKEWALDRALKGLARFFAKIMGQPDPITWAPNPASQAVKKTENIVGKVRNAANQTVEKASTIAGKAVDNVNQATEKLQQVIPQQEPVAPTPAAPVQPTPVVDQPVQTPSPTV